LAFAASEEFDQAAAPDESFGVGFGVADAELMKIEDPYGFLGFGPEAEGFLGGGVLPSLLRDGFGGDEEGAAGSFGLPADRVLGSTGILGVEDPGFEPLIKARAEEDGVGLSIFLPERVARGLEGGKGSLG
jgi:hypothetical protein